MKSTLLIFFSSCLTIGLAFDQSFGITGKLFCGSVPAIDVTVKLWEEDPGPFPNGIVDQELTDDSGEFHLQGSTDKLNLVDPIFKIYHNCDADIEKISRRARFIIPQSYITFGKKAVRIFDIGNINLEIIYPDEEREGTV